MDYDKVIRIQKEFSDELELHRLSTNAKHMDAQTEKHFKTLAIGILSEIEKTFGFLWGIDKKSDNLTEDEKEWREDWMILRAFILDNMHKRVNILKKDLDRFNLQTKRYFYEANIQSKD